MIQAYKKGFTIIELMLAMAFISILLLSIVTIAIQTGKLYSRGMTLKTVNQAGRGISDVVRRDFSQSDRRQISDPGVIMSRYGGVERNGRACLGTYSYVWNVPEVIDSNLTNPSQGVVVGADNKPINFVRVVDKGGVLCQADGSGRYPVRLGDDTEITHLLKRHSKDEVVLAVHSFAVAPVAWVEDGSDGLFDIGFTIGTSRQSEINTLTQSCRPPSDSQANVDYCTINNFNMTVRTNGQGL